jgi:hypothetical protein
MSKYYDANGVGTSATVLATTGEDASALRALGTTPAKITTASP